MTTEEYQEYLYLNTYCYLKRKPLSCLLNWFTHSMPRQKLDRTSLHARVEPQTSEALKQIAYKLGYIYDGEGSIGQLLDAIASGKHMLIPKYLYLKMVDVFKEMSNNIKCGENTSSHSNPN